MCLPVRYCSRMGNTSLSLPVSGRKIRELRELRGWRQADLSAACAEAGKTLSRERISRIENGFAKPSAASLTVLAKVLKVDIEDLLYERRDAA